MSRREQTRGLRWRLRERGRRVSDKGKPEFKLHTIDFGSQFPTDVLQLHDLFSLYEFTLRNGAVPQRYASICLSYTDDR